MPPISMACGVWDAVETFDFAACVSDSLGSHRSDLEAEAWNRGLGVLHQDSQKYTRARFFKLLAEISCFADNTALPTRTRLGVPSLFLRSAAKLGSCRNGVDAKEANTN
jgi:hypothetical protein